MKLPNLFRKKIPQPTWQEKLLSPDIALLGWPDLSYYPSPRVDEIDRSLATQKFSYRKLRPGTFLWFKYQNKYCIGRLLASGRDMEKAGIETSINKAFHFCHLALFKGWHDAPEEVETLEVRAIIGGLDPSIYKVDPLEDYEIGFFGYLPLKPEDLAFKEGLSFWACHVWRPFEGKERMIYRTTYNSGEIRIHLPIFEIAGDKTIVLGYGDIDTKEFVFSEYNMNDLRFSVGYPFHFNRIFEHLLHLDSSPPASDPYLPDFMRFAPLGLEFQPRLREVVYEIIHRPLDMGYYEFAQSQGLDLAKFLYT